MRSARVAVIGAGMGGLAAALDLSRAGLEVLLFEQAAAPGGKLRELTAGVGFDTGQGLCIPPLR